MNSIKRLYISIKGQIDQAADEFENHEALAGIAIQELQSIDKTTRLHLHRVSKMTEQYQKQLDQQKQHQSLWTTRAIKAKEQDEQKAIQCVKRLLQTKKQIALLEQQLEESSQQENKTRDDLNSIQKQLLVLKNKKEMFAVRQNRSHIQTTLQDNQINSLDNVQQVFDRWEGRIVSTEHDIPVTPSDTLLDDFEQEEEALALKMLLDELIDPKQSANNNK